MFRRLRTWLISLRDLTVADQAAEIKAWEERGAAYYDELQRLKQSLSDVRAVRTRLLKVIDAILTGIDFPIDSVNEEWKTDPDQARLKIIGHLFVRERPIEQRAESAESACNDLRWEIARLKQQLETEQRAHEQTKHEKRCTEAENLLLSNIHETDVARRVAERQIEVRREVEAKVAVDLLKDD